MRDRHFQSKGPDLLGIPMQYEFSSQYVMRCEGTLASSGSRSGMAICKYGT